MNPEERDRGYARFGLNYRSSTATVSQLLDASRSLLARHKEARLRPVFEGMEQAISYGTARLAAIPAVKVAGKTGTTSSSALFFGYAPAEDPKYLVWVQLDSGSGGGDAAPYAAKVFASLFSAAKVEFDPSTVSVRLFWGNPPSRLNLKPGTYPAGTLIDTGLTQMISAGSLTVVEKQGRFELTTSMNLEAYVRGVLHGEAGGFHHKA